MKNKNALKYEMTDWKQLQIRKQNTKEVISVQKTKLRQELKRQRIGQKRFRKIVYVVIAVLAVLYIAGTIYYSRHFYTGGTAFGISLRNESIDSIKEKIAEKMNAYHLTITTRDGDETIDASSIDLKYDDQGELEALFEKQKAFLWFLMGATAKEDIPLGITMDEQKLDDTIAALSCIQEETMSAPTDAHLEYKDGKFQIAEEQLGNQLDIQKADRAIDTAIKHNDKEYVFIVHNVTDSQGGLEHVNSTTLSVNRWGYSPDKYKRFLTLVAHEYFHLWNVKRMRAIELGPFNYDEETYTSLLWVMEGFTSYYYDLIM